MAPRFGALAHAFAERFFTGFALAPEEVERLRGLEARGAVVYVMRYTSRLDYFLFNWLFLRSGIRLTDFANGIRLLPQQPLGAGLRLIARRIWLARLRRSGLRERGLSLVRASVRGQRSAFLFLRADQLVDRARPAAQAVESAQSEIDYLREVLDAVFDEPLDVALVPLAVFWRARGRGRRMLDVLYGSPERPSVTWKLLSFLWSYRNLAVRIGTPIDLRAFVDERREQGRAVVVKQVRRSILIFLRREEKPVLGAALRSLAGTEAVVLNSPEVVAAIAEQGGSTWLGRWRARRSARRQLRGIASRPNPTVLALLDMLVSWVFRRLFQRIDVTGFEEVVEAAKLHPLVLLPNHRSHFDYLILSWLFYERHLAPPLVAAGANLSFWPLGPILRRGGAFFLRRSFDGDPVYTAVFRSYVQLLIKDGASQEFFIEGGRSRTGKTLQPRLGLLRMIVEAFARGVRRDVYLVPIGFTYERLVEERSMTGEKRGGAKTQESLGTLFQARRVLRSRFGSVAVRFGEPISLAEVTGLAPRSHAAEAAHLRKVAARLGDEISRRINDLITAGRSSVSAVALLGGRGPGLRVRDFRDRVVEVVALLDLAGLARSGNLARELAEGRPEAAIDLLEHSGLVGRRRSAGGDIFEFDDEGREALAYYRATLSPALIWPAALALAMRVRPGQKPEELRSEAAAWVDLLRLEYFPPALEAALTQLDRFLEHFVERGWLEISNSGRVQLLPEGERWMAFLAHSLRPVLETYAALFEAAVQHEGDVRRHRLLAAAETILEEHLLLGEAQCPESLCKTTLGNALALLVADGVLSLQGNLRDPDAELSRGPRWEGLDARSQRVARALADG